MRSLFFIFLACSISTHALAGGKMDLIHRCTPSAQGGNRLTNGDRILPFNIYTVGYPVEAAYIQFEGGKKIPAKVSSFLGDITFDTGSIAVTLRNNGLNSFGTIKYFGQDGNYFVNGVETYNVGCGNPY